MIIFKVKTTIDGFISDVYVNATTIGSLVNILVEQKVEHVYDVQILGDDEAKAIYINKKIDMMNIHWYGRSCDLRKVFGFGHRDEIETIYEMSKRRGEGILAII